MERLKGVKGKEKGVRYKEMMKIPKGKKEMKDCRGKQKATREEKQLEMQT